MGQIIAWCITIYVIRILNPTDYGLMAMAAVCIGFLTTISELGLGAAIVQKKDINHIEIQQVFGFVLLCHFGLSILMFAGAPLLSAYFNEPQLVPIFKVLSINFILASLYIIPQSILLRRMDFRSKALIDCTASLISVVVTLISALNDYGVWSLVYGAVTIHAVSIFGYNVFSQKIIRPRLSFRGMKKLFLFGGFLTGGRILWYFYSKADIFIGGRFLSSRLLGTYSVALEMVSIPLEKILPIINQVAFPAYSSVQSDAKIVRSYFLKSVRIVSFFIFPIYSGLLVVAPELIDLILGSKWDGVIMPLQILCLVMPFRALSTLFTPVLNGIGRTDITFVNVCFASVLMPIAFLIGAKWGIGGMAMAWLLGYFVVFIFISQRSLKTLGISMSIFFLNLRGSFIASMTMWVVVYGVRYVFINSLSHQINLFFLIVLGIVTYIFSTFTINRSNYNEIWGIIKSVKR
ncbi:MAG: lipopolysaccharide biosynthesis protein [Desulfobacteraceae bacterium]|nr:lipopolysaccharide biosynthesis protein [Desulfobacteraceae bacterium]MBC2720927.1 lipopolysaccharide biosynthesis protein [Desulfobacteraceae bacterium]